MEVSNMFDICTYCVFTLHSSYENTEYILGPGSSNMSIIQFDTMNVKRQGMLLLLKYRCIEIEARAL